MFLGSIWYFYAGRHWFNEKITSKQLNWSISLYQIFNLVYDFIINLKWSLFLSNVFQLDSFVSFLQNRISLACVQQHGISRVCVLQVQINLDSAKKGDFILFLYMFDKDMDNFELLIEELGIKLLRLWYKDKYQFNGYWKIILVYTCMNMIYDMIN